jgi:aspartyl protease
MPCLWLQHNNSQLFVNVGIIDASAISFAALPATMAPLQMFRALVDTGAQKTMIMPNVATALKLQAQGQIQVLGVGGVTWHNWYLFHVAFTIPFLPHGQPLPPPGQPVALTIAAHVNPNVIAGGELPLSHGFDVLLGMDILSSGSLKIEGNGQASFSF